MLVKPSGRILFLVLALALVALLAFVHGSSLSAAPGNPGVYTLDADYDEGTLVNVNHNTPNNDQLQLDEAPTPLEFIWVAASARGTIVKIDTVTGAVLGEYRSAPEGRGLNPSRTTVDGNGNVWSANRDESADNKGSAVKIGLLENNQCVDRDGSGTIETSTGLGDILSWPDITDGAGGADGVVEDAADECILLYQRLDDAINARHVSVDANNDVWVGGYPFDQRMFYLLDGGTAAFLDSFDARAYGCGGYGGLVDGNGILWSASISQSNLLRYDPASDTGSCIPVSQSYGLGIDTTGYIWNAMWSNNTIVKLSPAGAIEPGFPKPTGGNSSRGVAVTAVDNDVWVANSGSNTVTRLDNAGALLATISVGSQPTGVAVDAAGKVWVTNLSSDDAMRIDPASNSVDLTVSLGAGAGPYNYSDMTGSTLIAPPDVGAWTIVHDSTILDAHWGYVTWTADTPGDSALLVTAASSTDGIVFSAAEPVVSGVDLTVPDGQYLRVSVSFIRATTDDDGDGFGDSPILYDLTILANRPPDCSAAYPSIGMIWPPNHKFVPIDVLGITDPDGDPFTITIDGIYQDEPVDTYGDGRFTPDGMGVGTSTAWVRAERTGTPAVPGNGRVYHIYFTADDGLVGGTCSGELLVNVPHNVGLPVIDDGPLYDSTALWP